MNYAEQRAAAFAALLGRLEAERGVVRASGATLDSLLRESDLLALLYTGEPGRSPESWDVAVVLPDLLDALGGMTGAILDPAESALAATRFGVDKLPALVVLKRGAYVGVVEGMRDWRPFLDELRALAAASPRDPPTAGVYVAQPPVARPS